jgi:hypothetical protein
MKQHFFKLLLPVLGAIGGCKDNPEQIPAYLDIKPFTVTETGPGKWQDIQEGWVYVNGDFLGAYTLPARVPALAAGSSEVLVFPGVKENGIETTPNIYDFLTRYEIQTDLKAGELNPISPSTKYKTEICRNILCSNLSQNPVQSFYTQNNAEHWSLLILIVARFSHNSAHCG